MSSQSRQKIIDTAKTLFAEQGFAATSIRDIAGKAKVNSCLISYYFGGKEGVLHSIVDGVFESEMPVIFGILDQAIDNMDEFKIRLEIFIDSIVTTGLRHWEVIRIIRRETHELSKRAHFTETSMASLKILSHFIEKAQIQKIIRDDFAAFTLADNILAITLNHISDWKLNSTHFDFDLSNKETRHNWIKENLLLMIHGVTKTSS